MTAGAWLAATLRGRRVVASALLVISVLAWVGVLRFASSMSAVASAPMAGMPGMEGMPGMVSAVMPFTVLLAMWVVMMIGMMTPSVAPMLLLYQRVGEQAMRTGQAFAAVGWFLAGYLTAWLLFSVAATLAHALLQESSVFALLTMSTDPRLGGAVLLLMGVYQWLPVKDRCLAQCRAPLQFIQQHGGFAADAKGALRLGLRHGLYCVGCCWALMLLLFVVGVMSLVWIAALMVFVLAEKLLPEGPLLARLAGIAAVVAGARLLVAVPGVSVVGFDHYNLSAHYADLERLRAFYVDVVGLREGPRPPIERFGYWLYAGDAAVLHLIEARPGERRDADVAGTFNHVALRCTDYDSTLAGLQARGVVMRIVEDRAQQLRQLFFRDPLGNGVELVFPYGTSAVNR